MSDPYQDSFEEWEERYFGGDYAAFLREYAPEDDSEELKRLYGDEEESQ